MKLKKYMGQITGAQAWGRETNSFIATISVREAGGLDEGHGYKGEKM